MREHASYEQAFPGCQSCFSKVSEQGISCFQRSKKRGDSKDGIDAGSNQLHFEDVFLVRQFFEGIHVKPSCCHRLELSM